MRDAIDAARDLLRASLEAADEYGIPTNAEELAGLVPLVKARDQEVARAVLDSVDLVLGLEAQGLTGQSAYYLRRARRLVQRARETFCGKGDNG